MIPSQWLKTEVYRAQRFGVRGKILCTLHKISPPLKGGDFASITEEGFCVTLRNIAPLIGGVMVSVGVRYLHAFPYIEETFCVGLSKISPLSVLKLYPSPLRPKKLVALERYPFDQQAACRHCVVTV